MDKKVSIIIPSYNNDHFLRESIDSALSQTYGNIEVIVIDDGSTDNSRNIIASYGNKIKAIYQKNSGASSARNSGIKISTGEIVMFLDSDDYIDKSFLEKTCALMNSTDAGLVYTGWQNIRNHQNDPPFIPPDYEVMDNKIFLLLENARWPIHAAIVKKQLVIEAGCFNTSLKSCEDFSLWLNIATRCKIGRVPEVLAYYRHHGHNQTSQNILQLAKDHWKIQIDYIHNHPEIYNYLDRRSIKRAVHGELMRRGFKCYWNRDLANARQLFRMVMSTGYGNMRDWMYMLPSFLPISLHKALINYFSDKGVNT